VTSADGCRLETVGVNPATHEVLTGHEIESRVPARPGNVPAVQAEPVSTVSIAAIAPFVVSPTATQSVAAAHEIACSGFRPVGSVSGSQVVPAFVVSSASAALLVVPPTAMHSEVVGQERAVTASAVGKVSRSVHVGRVVVLGVVVVAVVVGVALALALAGAGAELRPVATSATSAIAQATLDRM
jgi:hypothetical protein